MVLLRKAAFPAGVAAAHTVRETYAADSRCAVLALATPRGAKHPVAFGSIHSSYKWLEKAQMHKGVARAVAKLGALAPGRWSLVGDFNWEKDVIVEKNPAQLTTLWHLRAANGDPYKYNMAYTGMNRSKLIDNAVVPRQNQNANATQRITRGEILYNARDSAGSAAPLSDHWPITFQIEFGVNATGPQAPAKQWGWAGLQAPAKFGQVANPIAAKWQAPAPAKKGGKVAYPNASASAKASALLVNPVKQAHGSYPVQTTVALHMYITDQQMDLQAWRKKAKL